MTELEVAGPAASAGHHPFQRLFLATWPDIGDGEVRLAMEPGKEGRTS